jgi:hypothetical protein
LKNTRSATVRWYQIVEQKKLFYITRDPIPIENFYKLEDSDTPQTYYNELIEDGSDELIPVSFWPEEDTTGIPRKVEIDIFYF